MVWPRLAACSPRAGIGIRLHNRSSDHTHSRRTRPNADTAPHRSVLPTRQRLLANSDVGALRRAADHSAGGFGPDRHAGPPVPVVRLARSDGLRAAGPDDAPALGPDRLRRRVDWTGAGRRLRAPGLLPGVHRAVVRAAAHAAD